MTNTTYTVYYRVEGSKRAFAPIRRLSAVAAGVAADDLRGRPGYVEVRIVEDETTHPSEMMQAYKAGWDAYLANEPMAPGLNTTVMTLIGEAPVGDPRTKDLMGAFHRGFESACNHDMKEQGL